jgi:hypothetical protein
MKNKFFILVIILLSKNLFSEDSKFAIPQRVEPVGVYTKIRIDAGGSEKRDINYYEREKQAYLEGELKFLEYFSIKLGTTKTQWEKSGAKTLTELDRFNVGLKFAREHSTSFGAFAWGFGTRLFDRQNPKLKRDDIAPDLYILKTHFNLGLKINNFEIITNFQFQSETNRQLKEEANQEFRRNYLGSIALSYGFTENLRGFLETEYRAPYNPKIDLNIRSWNLYPGFSYQIYSGGFLGFSVQIPMLQERTYDRGVRLSYYHVF